MREKRTRNEGSEAAESQGQRSHSSPGAELGVGLASYCPVQFLNYFIFLCSIKAKHLKVVLGDQDLKKTEFHEQTFRVEKIIKYSCYNERDEIPYNDIGKSPL